MRTVTIDEVLGRLFHEPPCPTPAPTLGAFVTLHRSATGELGQPIARAMVGGFIADRPAWAFAAGYREALRRIRPACGEALVALAATEEGGNQPRAIRTRLRATPEGLRLRGSKRFVTMGPVVERILVVAARGQRADGRPELVVVDVPREREGVHVATTPALPFVPELPHGALELHDVSVAPDEVDEGDGYVSLLKPFRTVEDLFVGAAFAAHALQVALRGGCDDGFLAAHLALLASLFALGSADPSAPATQVALEGSLRQLHTQLDALPLDSVELEVRERLRRDRALLSVARDAREKRFHTAVPRLR